MSDWDLTGMRMYNIAALGDPDHTRIFERSYPFLNHTCDVVTHITAPINTVLTIEGSFGQIGQPFALKAGVRTSVHIPMYLAVFTTVKTVFEPPVERYKVAGLMFCDLNPPGRYIYIEHLDMVSRSGCIVPAAGTQVLQKVVAAKQMRRVHQDIEHMHVAKQMRRVCNEIVFKPGSNRPGIRYLDLVSFIDSV